MSKTETLIRKVRAALREYGRDDRGFIIICSEPKKDKGIEICTISDFPRIVQQGVLQLAIKTLEEPEGADWEVVGE